MPSPTLPTLDTIRAAFPALEVIELIGRGGMGSVFKARQPQLDRFVALKILPTALAEQPGFSERFQREAQALARLNHPHIVTVHDFGQAGGLFYLLMEFVDGVNLRQLLQTKRLTPKEALSIVPPVCDALQCAHDHGIVHRDIKPENLLIDKAGVVKIADFGIAKMLGARHSDAAMKDGDFGESRSQPLGTPDYAAPEQATGAADHSADIYSLGVVLYEMLTGERPKENLTPPSKRVQVDIRIDEIVLRALEKTPELRFATAAEFRAQVEAVAQGGMAPAWWRGLQFPFILLMALDMALVVFVMQSSSGLPDTLATHFNAAGKANGWMSIDAYVLYACLIPVGFMALFGLPVWLMWRYPSVQPNVPNKAYWMKPENRGRALGMIARSMLWMSSLLVLFVGALHWQVMLANRVSPPTFPSGTMTLVLVVFFTVLILWIVNLIYGFTKLDLDAAAVVTKKANHLFPLWRRLLLGAALVLVPLVAFLAVRARQSGRLASEALQALAEQKAASFSPVVERVLSLPDAAAETCALNLDSGNFVPVPEEIRAAARDWFIAKVNVPESEARLQRWATATGADVMLIKAEPRITLAFFNGGIAFPGFSFSKAGHLEVARIAVETKRRRQTSAQGTQSSPPFVVIEQPELDRDGASKAVFFQTRENKIGLLQIIGLTDETNRVRLRYKFLVPPGQTEARTLSPRPSLTEDLGHADPAASPLTSSLANSENSPEAIAKAQQLGIAEATRDIQAGIRRIFVYGLLMPETGKERDEQTGYRLQRVAGSILSSAFQAEAAAYNYAMREHWQLHDQWNPPKPPGKPNAPASAP